jgi:hypothetical protein
MVEIDIALRATADVTAIVLLVCVAVLAVNATAWLLKRMRR